MLSSLEYIYTHTHMHLCSAPTAFKSTHAHCPKLIATANETINITCHFIGQSSNLWRTQTIESTFPFLLSALSCSVHLWIFGCVLLNLMLTTHTKLKSLWVIDFILVIKPIFKRKARIIRPNKKVEKISNVSFAIHLIHKTCLNEKQLTKHQRPQS